MRVTESFSREYLYLAQHTGEPILPLGAHYSITPISIPHLWLHLAFGRKQPK